MIGTDPPVHVMMTNSMDRAVCLKVDIDYDVLDTATASMVHCCMDHTRSYSTADATATLLSTDACMQSRAHSIRYISLYDTVLSVQGCTRMTSMYDTGAML